LRCSATFCILRFCAVRTLKAFCYRRNCTLCVCVRACSRACVYMFVGIGLLWHNEVSLVDVDLSFLSRVFNSISILLCLCVCVSLSLRVTHPISLSPSILPSLPRNRNLKTSKALLKSQAHQGISSSAATNPRGVVQRVVKRARRGQSSC